MTADYTEEIQRKRKEMEEYILFSLLTKENIQFSLQSKFFLRDSVPVRYVVMDVMTRHGYQEYLKEFNLGHKKIVEIFEGHGFRINRDCYFPTVDLLPPKPKPIKKEKSWLKKILNYPD